MICPVCSGAGEIEVREGVRQTCNDCERSFCSCSAFSTSQRIACVALSLPASLRVPIVCPDGLQVSISISGDSGPDTVLALVQTPISHSGVSVEFLDRKFPVTFPAGFHG